MTSEEQLQAWAEGRSLHRPTTNHPSMDCIDPPGRDGRRWRCVECSATAVLAELRRIPCSKSTGECVPDFSCCKPELAQPIEVRRAFLAAPEAQRDRFCAAFLGAALSGVKVHVAGCQPEGE